MTDHNLLSPYHLGRPEEVFKKPYLGSNKTFAAQRHDGEVIDSPEYKHCTLVNISLKKAKLKNGNFQDCIFIGCYFRRAELNNCKFVGCRFFDCNFSHVSLKSCDFRYSIFRGCHIDYYEIKYSLPSEPNLRHELTRNLSVESLRIGVSQESRQYRMAEIDAHEQHLKAAISGESQWYKEHFDCFGRFKAFFELTLSLLNRWLWGYGEHATVLVRNLILLVFFVFPILFYVFKDQLSNNLGRQVGLFDFFYFSLENVIPAGGGSEIVAIGSITRFLAGFESLLGVVSIALFAAYIFRWSIRR